MACQLDSLPVCRFSNLQVCRLASQFRFPGLPVCRFASWLPCQSASLTAFLSASLAACQFVGFSCPRAQ
eukprot:11623935-Alexandrium_andersonii.AAC.1